LHSFSLYILTTSASLLTFSLRHFIIHIVHYVNMFKSKPCFFCLMFLLLLLSTSESRPLQTPPTFKRFPAQLSGNRAQARSSVSLVFSEFEESPRKPGRLAPEGPDPKHH
ncbi:hypothetical protein VIGAN_05049900, partial [Vigna angularis var. angularis]